MTGTRTRYRAHRGTPTDVDDSPTGKAYTQGYTYGGEGRKALTVLRADVNLLDRRFAAGAMAARCRPRMRVSRARVDEVMGSLDGSGRVLQGRKVVCTLIWSREVPCRLRAPAGAHRGGPMTSSECLHLPHCSTSTTPPKPMAAYRSVTHPGARTEGPEGGHHVLQEGRVNRSTEWLDTQTRIRAIAHSQTQPRASDPDKATQNEDVPVFSLD